VQKYLGHVLTPPPFDKPGGGQGPRWLTATGVPALEISHNILIYIVFFVDEENPDGFQGGHMPKF
jgi:hypothetical protein